MSPLFLSVYILIWPAITAVLLVLLTAAVIRDYRNARKSGTDVV